MNRAILVISRSSNVRSVKKDTKRSSNTLLCLVSFFTEWTLLTNNILHEWKKVQNLISVQSCLFRSLEYPHLPLFDIFQPFQSELCREHRNSSRISTGILVGKAAGFTYCIIQLVVKILQYLPLEHHQLLLDWTILTENPKIGAEPLYHSSYSEI